MSGERIPAWGKGFVAFLALIVISAITGTGLYFGFKLRDESVRPLFLPEDWVEGQDDSVKALAGGGALAAEVFVFSLVVFCLYTLRQCYLRRGSQNLGLAGARVSLMGAGPRDAGGAQVGVSTADSVSIMCAVVKDRVLPVGKVDVNFNPQLVGQLPHELTKKDDPWYTTQQKEWAQTLRYIFEFCNLPAEDLHVPAIQDLVKDARGFQEFQRQCSVVLVKYIQLVLEFHDEGEHKISEHGAIQPVLEAAYRYIVVDGRGDEEWKADNRLREDDELWKQRLIYLWKILLLDIKSQTYPDMQQSCEGLLVANKAIVGKVLAAIDARSLKPEQVPRLQALLEKVKPAEAPAP